MKLKKQYPIDIYFYLGDSSENDNRYYFLNTNEFKNHEYPILNIGQIYTEYLNIDLRDIFPIIEEFKGKSFNRFLVHIIEKMQQKHGFIISALICNDLITLINELLESSNYSKFYKKKYSELKGFDKLYKERYGEYPTEDSCVKDIILGFIPYIGTNMNLYKEFLKRFFQGDTTVFNLINELFPKTMNISYSIIPNIDVENLTHCFLETFKIIDLNTFLKFDILKIIQRGIDINQCENCGKYFIPKSKSNEKYCDNIFKNNKTCKELSYDIKLENDEISKIYRTVYKTQNAKKTRNSHIKDIQSKFKTWTIKAKEQKQLCEDKKISIEEFKQWLKDNENWHIKEDKNGNKRNIKK